MRRNPARARVARSAQPLGHSAPLLRWMDSASRRVIFFRHAAICASNGTDKHYRRNRPLLKRHRCFDAFFECFLPPCPSRYHCPPCGLFRGDDNTPACLRQQRPEKSSGQKVAQPHAVFIFRSIPRCMGPCHGMKSAPVPGRPDKSRTPNIR